MNPSTRAERRFRVHLIPRKAAGVDKELDITYIEEAKDLDDLEHKLLDYCGRKGLQVRAIDELED